MQRNRYFKSTYGTSGEFFLPKSLDRSATPVDPVDPTGGTVTVTVAGTPTAGDVLNIFVGGQPYSYVVKAGDSTAATLVASIVADFNLNSTGYVASVSGTTSAVFTIKAPTGSGTKYNGTIVTAAAGTNAGPTFTAISVTNFGTNGVDAVEAGPQPTLDTFVANAAVGTIGVYWMDTRKAVAPGATALYANKDRVFVYAWKHPNGNTITSTGLKAGTRQYRTVPYNAGAVDVWTITVSGTITAGQILHIKVIDITALNIPNPTWEWIVVSTGTIATDLAAIRDLINGEQQEPWFTATASGAVLTITSTDNKRQMRVAYQLEVTGQLGTTLGTDSTAAAFAQTTKSVAESGTPADVAEFENYVKYQNGVMVYTREGITAAEMNSYTTAVDQSTTYGYLLVKVQKEEIHKSSAVPAMKNDHFVMIAIQQADLAALAGY